MSVFHRAEYSVALEIILLIDCLHKLADHERYALNPFDFFLSSNKLPFETSGERSEKSLISSLLDYGLPLFIFDIFLLKVNIPE